MERVMLKSIGLFSGVLLLSVTVWGAQAPAPPPSDELTLSWLETVKVAAEFANSDCQRLESVKKFNNLRQVTQMKIESRLPGYTVDWPQFAVVAKKPAAVTAPAAK